MIIENEYLMNENTSLYEISEIMGRNVISVKNAIDDIVETRVNIKL